MRRARWCSAESDNNQSEEYWAQDPHLTSILASTGKEYRRLSKDIAPYLSFFVRRSFSLTAFVSVATIIFSGQNVSEAPKNQCKL